jgi:NAD(P)H-dependent flavin oxidoreductase YrpB (nitropropane dioxygenase family)
MLGIKHPIIQGGMGPYNTTRLAAAVSNAGGMGTISIPGMTIEPKEAARIIKEYLSQIIMLTDKPFAVNTPIGEVSTVLPTMEAIVDTVLEEREKNSKLKRQLKLYITSAGYSASIVSKIKQAGMLHFHVVGSVRHAKKIEAEGLDGVIASGYEMGGHTHLADRAVHTFVLVPAVVKAVKVPVVASGGICDAEGLVAALAFGAIGIQMGTRFIATKEIDWHENYCRLVIQASEWSDTVIPLVYGPGRVLKTPGIEIVKKLYEDRRPLNEIHIIEDEMMRLAEREGDEARGIILAGQVASRINEVLTVAEIINSIVEGAVEIIRQLPRKVVKDSL